MSILGNLHKKLIERKFIDCEEEICGYKIYTNGIYQVFLVTINQFIKLSRVMEDLSELRKYIINKNLNIWNTYIIFCVEEEEIDKCFSIDFERDSRYFRKYVIKSADEIDRISFLNINLSISEENKISLNQKFVFEKKYSLDIFNHFDDYCLKDKKLNNNEIIEITKNIFEIVGVDYENK